MEALAFLCGVGFAVVVVALAAGGCAYYVMQSSRDRWLGEPGEMPAGEGAFREGRVAIPPRLQRRRYFTVAVAVMNALLAMFTIFLCAPAGVLGALIGINEAHENAWFWWVVGVAALDALPVSVALIVASMLLARRADNAKWVGVGIGAWGLGHHGALITAGVLLALTATRRYGMTDSEMGLTTAALACLGVLPSLATVVAGLFAERPTKRA